MRALPGNPGGTSLDRLVLNQLVTVLQATSALSGAGRQGTAVPGPGTTQVQHASDLGNAAADCYEQLLLQAAKHALDMCDLVLSSWKGRKCGFLVSCSPTDSVQATARPSGSNRRRRHPSERRRVSAAVQLPGEEPPQAFPTAAMRTVAEHTPAPVDESEAGRDPRHIAINPTCGNFCLLWFLWKWCCWWKANLLTD